MSSSASFDLDLANRWFGVEFNNAIFPLLAQADRTEEDTERMIALAYASTLHWRMYSKHTIANSARGENMIATALSYAGRAEAALHHARRNYDIVMNNLEAMADFDLSYALMVMARALALNKQMIEAKDYLERARVSISEIKDPEDKKICETDIAAGPWYGLQ